MARTCDDVVNSGGVLVHPMEVEQAFTRLVPSWVQDFVVYGRPDDTLGFEVVLRVQSDAPIDDLEGAFSRGAENSKTSLEPPKRPAP